MTIVNGFTEYRPTDERIAAFEKAVEGVLPEDYKSFLKQKNGGRPKPNYLLFKKRNGREEDTALQYFYALCDERVGSIEENFGIMKGRIPAGFLPIATDSFGNKILLRITPQGTGKVYFWDHEEEDDDEEFPTMKNISQIAVSFSELLGLLQEP